MTHEISTFAMLLISLLFSPTALGPPLPLDPTLAAIAPENCLFYATSAGIAEPDPNSTNQTEQLFAEPEIRLFATTLKKEALAALKRSAAHRPDQQTLTNELPKLLEAALTRPLAVYVEDFEFIENRLNLKAGLLLNAGKNSDALKKSIDQLVALLQAKGTPINIIDGEKGEIWHSLRTSPNTPEIRWGWHGNYLLIGVGEGTIETMLKRMTGQSPTWLTKLRRDNPIERESTLMHLNAEALLARVKPMLGSNWSNLEKAGLTSIQSLHSISGFDELGCTTTTQLVTDGSQQGIFALIPDQQLSAKDLRIIPADAMIATATRIDTAETLKNFLRLLEEFDPRAPERFERNHQRFESKLGVNIQDDLLRSLDDTWTLHMPGGNLMTAWLGTTATCKVKDSKRLAEAVQKIVVAVRAEQRPGARRGVRIRESQFEKHTLYTLTFIGEAVPFTPCWCVTDERFLVGLTPQTVRALITREQADLPRDESLAYSDSLRPAFQAKTAPTAIVYCNSPELVRAGYPLLQMGTQMLSSQLQAMGLDVDSSILPSADAIIKHLRPSVTTFTNDGKVLTIHSTHSIPGAGSLPALAPLGIGATLPAKMGARRAARNRQDINQMKQIALACLIYESSHGKLPTNIYDDNGKALLSWRVQLLPYLGDNKEPLDFHLDEPWDSLHNLPLSKKRPQVFGSLVHPELTKTRFLALVGPNTLFPGNEKITFSQVIDGTSNTIMFVQAAPESAVPWSKPQDIQFDSDKPFQSIRTPHGQFAFAMSDGSVRRVSLQIGKETMRRLVTRNDGEAIDRSNF